MNRNQPRRVFFLSFSVYLKSFLADFSPDQSSQKKKHVGGFLLPDRSERAGPLRDEVGAAAARAVSNVPKVGKRFRNLKRRDELLWPAL